MFKVFFYTLFRVWHNIVGDVECFVDDASFNHTTSPSGQLKQPLLYLPPPPQHPPPSSGARRHLSTDDTCEDEDIYSRIPASSSEAGDNYPPSLPLVDYYTGHSSGYDVVDTGSYNDGLDDSLPPPRPPKAPSSKMVSASPQLQRRISDQVTCVVFLHHGTAPSSIKKCAASFSTVTLVFLGYWKQEWILYSQL